MNASMQKLLAAAGFTSLLISAPAMAGTVTSEGEDIVLGSEGGLSLRTADNAFKFQFSGRVQLDGAYYDGLSTAALNEPYESATDFYIRRSKLEFEGTVYSNWLYAISLEYKDGGDVEFDDAYFGYSSPVWGTWSAGRVDADVGIEDATSSKWITAIERPILDDVKVGGERGDLGFKYLYGGRNFGITGYITNAEDKPDDSNNEALGYTLRATYAPILKPNQVLHLGAGYHYSDKNKVEIRSRMGIYGEGKENRFEFAEVDKASRDSEFTLEAAYQINGLRLQSEYLKREVRGTRDDEKAEVDVDTYYAQVSYMFGADRGYDAAEGKWKKPSAFNSWEIFARYENINVDPSGEAVKKDLLNEAAWVINEGGEIESDAYVIGVNYFPNESIRTSLNYVYYSMDNVRENKKAKDANSSAFDDSTNAVVGRIQYVF